MYSILSPLVSIQLLHGISPTMRERCAVLLQGKEWDSCCLLKFTFKIVHKLPKSLFIFNLACFDWEYLQLRLTFVTKPRPASSIQNISTPVILRIPIHREQLACPENHMFSAKILIDYFSLSEVGKMKTKYMSTQNFQTQNLSKM